MYQIKKDLLLGIHPTHPITCPLINPLQFTGKRCTRIYKIDLESDPSSLIVDASDLLQAINDLDQWTTDLIDLYDELDDDIKDKLRETSVLEYIEAIEETQKVSMDFEIENYEKDINRLLSTWEKEKSQYENIQTNIENLENDLNKVAKSLSLSEDEDEIADLEDSYSLLDSELSATKIELATAEDDFDNNTKYELESLTDEFSHHLEMVRTRNDTLRMQVASLRNEIMTHAKKELELEQPNEYLIEKFGITDALSSVKALNLGLLYNEYTEYHQTRINHNLHGNEYFKKLILDFEHRGIFTKEDRVELIEKLDPIIKNDDYIAKFNIPRAKALTREHKKEVLFEKLKEKGYEIIRYYEDEKTYLSDRLSFKVDYLNAPDSTLKLKHSKLKM